MNDMREQIISFETAKLAKEKGFNFNEYCAKMYGNQVKPQLEKFSGGRYNFYHDYYSAPTQSLLQKWIREVHNIHMEIQIFNDDTWGGDLIYKDAEYEHNDYNAPLDVENCKTYEEALELLLQKALLLIKND